MGLRDLFIDIRNDYSNYGVHSTDINGRPCIKSDKEHYLQDEIYKEIPGILKLVSPNNQSIYGRTNKNTWPLDCSYAS